MEHPWWQPQQLLLCGRSTNFMGGGQSFLWEKVYHGEEIIRVTLGGGHALAANMHFRQQTIKQTDRQTKRRTLPLH